MVYLYYKIFKAIHERAKKAMGQKIAAKSKRNPPKGFIIENASQTNQEASIGNMHYCF